MTKPEKKLKSSWEDAYEIIQQQILTMKIKPDEAVTEIALSEKLGIGRTPVREALKRLEQEGLIITNNRRKRVYSLTISEVEEIFDLKVCIDSFVVKWATEKGKEDDFKELKRILDKMKLIASQKPEREGEEDGYFKDWLEADRQLHSLIYKMANNQRADQFMKNLDVQWHRLRLGMYTLEGRIQKSVIEHENFVQAILNRNPSDAEKAMVEHLENVKRELVKILKLFQQF